MYSSKVIHFDIKPDNIIIVDEFKIKFIDFSTARILVDKFNSNDLLHR